MKIYFNFRKREKKREKSLQMYVFILQRQILFFDLFTINYTYNSSLFSFPHSILLLLQCYILRDDDIVTIRKQKTTA
jgi:hypothetical protein